MKLLNTHRAYLRGREQCGLIRVLGKEALEDPTWDRDVDRVLLQAQSGKFQILLSYLSMKEDLSLARLEVGFNRGC